MEEIWKTIAEYPNYKVSNLGNVINIKKNKLMSIYPKRNKYMMVKLSKGNIQKEKRVHRLVAEAFIPNMDNLPCINHIDENTKNNCKDNLEWCTPLYNNTYGTRLQKQSKSLKNTWKTKLKSLSKMLMTP